MMAAGQQALWEQAHGQPRFRPRYPHEEVVRRTLRHFERQAAPGVAQLQASAGERGLAVQTMHVAGHDLAAYPDAGIDGMLSFVAPFGQVSIDRMSYHQAAFSDDDWVVSAMQRADPHGDQESCRGR